MKHCSKRRSTPLSCRRKRRFLAEALGFRVIADSLDLDCHWVPLATTRRFLRDNRETARKIASIYAESARLFKSQPQETIKEISRSLPRSRRSSRGRREVLPLVCCRVRAELGAFDEFPRVDIERGRAARPSSQQSQTGRSGGKPAIESLRRRPMTDRVKTVGVLGLGVMGFDIAFLYAQKGYRTLVYDAAEAGDGEISAAARSNHRAIEEAKPHFRR